MAFCISTKVFSIKAFEVGLIFATFVIIPTVFSAPMLQTRQVNTIESKLMNPCGYREKIRHGRSAKERQMESQVNITKYEYKNALLQLNKLHNTTSLNAALSLQYTLPTTVVGKKKRNYESVQTYIKTFDTLANQEISPDWLETFKIPERKQIFNTLTDSLVRLLCQMFDEQKRNHPTKVKPKILNFHKNITMPVDASTLYGQDQLVLKEYGKFIKKLDEFTKKTRKNRKNRQKKTKNSGVKKTKLGAEQKRKGKKLLNRRKNGKKIVS